VLRIKTFLLVILSSISASALFGAGNTAANFLKIEPGARPAAIGGAYTAVANDASAVYWNAAGLSNLKSSELIVAHNIWFQDIQHSYVAFALPFGSSLSRYPSNSCLGFSATYLNAGSMENRDASGALTGNSFSADDMSVSVAYARNLAAFTGTPLSAGITLKFIKQEIAQYSANSVACDIGMMYPFAAAGIPFNLGLAVMNVGTPVKFISEEYPLPLTLKTGVSFAPFAKSLSLPLMVSLDASFPNDSAANWSLGTEYSVGNMLQLRAGYLSQDSLTRGALMGGSIGSGDESAITRLTGLMAGFGVKIPLSRFSNSTQALNLDYAFVPYGELGDTHRISLGMKW